MVLNYYYPSLMRLFSDALNIFKCFTHGCTFWDEHNRAVFFYFGCFRERKRKLWEGLSSEKVRVSWCNEQDRSMERGQVFLKGLSLSCALLFLKCLQQDFLLVFINLITNTLKNHQHLAVSLTIFILQIHSESPLKMCRAK